MTKKQYDRLKAERDVRKPLVIQKADELIEQVNLSPLAASEGTFLGIWAMDGVLRTVLTDIDPYWVRWTSFREKWGVEENLLVIEGWDPERS